MKRNRAFPTSIPLGTDPGLEETPRHSHRNNKTAMLKPRKHQNRNIEAADTPRSQHRSRRKSMLGERCFFPCSQQILWLARPFISSALGAPRPGGCSRARGDARVQRLCHSICTEKRSEAQQVGISAPRRRMVTRRHTLDLSQILLWLMKCNAVLFSNCDQIQTRMVTPPPRRPSKLPQSLPHKVPSLRLLPLRRSLPLSSPSSL